MNFWTDSNIELLRKRWAKGVSARLIAKELGSVSRNAVVGKVYRLKLAGRTTVEAQPRKYKPSAISNTLFHGYRAGRQAPAHRSAKTKTKAIEEAPPIDLNCSMLELDNTPWRPSKCRWLTGDSRFPLDPIFCGCKPISDSPYCEYHAGRARG
jgi:GcrA cell cycle regulator